MRPVSSGCLLETGENVAHAFFMSCDWITEHRGLFEASHQTARIHEPTVLRSDNSHRPQTDQTTLSLTRDPLAPRVRCQIKNLWGYRSIRRVTLSGCCSNLLYVFNYFFIFSLPVAKFPSTVIGMFAVWARMSSCQSEWALSQQQETQRFKRNEGPTLINEKPRWGIFRSNLRQEALLELETHTKKTFSLSLMAITMIFFYNKKTSKDFGNFR